MLTGARYLRSFLSVRCQQANRKVHKKRRDTTRNGYINFGWKIVGSTIRLDRRGDKCNWIHLPLMLINTTKEIC